MTSRHTLRLAADPRRAPCIACAIAIGCALSAHALAAPDAPPVPAPSGPTAAAKPPILVLEAHVGARPSELDAVVGPVLDELEQRGFAAHPASITRVLGGRAPRPGVLDGGKTAAEITQLIERGFDAFTRGEYKDAETSLGLAVHQIKRNPALLVLDATNARSTFHAFVGLALSQAKLGNAADSVETMTELLRSFSTQTITRSEYGPQAEQVYRAVQKQTQLMGRGRLTVAAGNDHAMIFVDGELRGMGWAALVDLIPGTYRVFIEVAGTSGRQYEVEVRANADSRLDVDWQIDSNLLVSSQWVGFVFANKVERSKEASYAGALSRRWGGDSIVIVGTTRLQGRSAVIATLYRASGEVERSAIVVAGGNDAGLHSLARFIADGTPSDELAQFTEAMERPTIPRPPESRSRRLIPAAAITAGTGLVAFGGVALYLGHLGGPNDPYRYTHATPVGITSIALGLGAAGAGLYLWRGPDGLRLFGAIDRYGSVMIWSGRF